MTLRSDMLKDLARSGISESQAKKLKLKPLTNKQTVDLGHLDAPSYLIPYFEPTGKVNGYHRVRYLTAPVGKFGESMTMSHAIADLPTRHHTRIFRRALSGQMSLRRSKHLLSLPKVRRRHTRGA